MHQLLDQFTGGRDKKARIKRAFREFGRTKQTRTADPHHVKVVL